MTIVSSTCTGTRHGTEFAYRSAGCSCPDAIGRHVVYQAELDAGIRRRVPALATIRRIQGLAADGHRLRDLARELAVTRGGVQNILTRSQVLSSTEWLVEALAFKLKDKPGSSTITRRRALEQWWLPLTAWDYGDIHDPHPLAEVTAMLGWLRHGPDPILALTELLRQFEALPAAAQQITTRRAHALHEAGATHPAVTQGEVIYQRHHKASVRQRDRQAAA